MEGLAGRRGVLLLVANEPRSYREAISQVLRQVRPEIEVVSLEPQELETAIRRRKPDMVVCGGATPAVRRQARVWVELYPEGVAHSRVGVDDQVTEVEHMQLADLLNIVDQGTTLAQ